MDTKTFVLHQLERTARWRRRKAEQYPDDRRNAEAAKLAEKLADDLRELSPWTDPLRTLDATHRVFPRAADDGSSDWARYFSRLGFQNRPKDAIELLRQVAPLLPE